MSDPVPGDYDEAELLAAMRKQLAEGRTGEFYAAYVRACNEDPKYGNLAGLMLHWITGGDNREERLDIADEILNGNGADPRQAKVLDVVHRFTAGQIGWDQLAKLRKKSLIPKERRVRASVAADAVPLSKAMNTLQAMLADAAEGQTPTLAKAWSVFTDFARRPVAPPRGRRIENEMCLFQWGVYDWGQGSRFECGLTRQFVIHDSDDNYDHMEQLSMTLLFDPADPKVSGLETGELWSDDDLRSWIKQIKALRVFAALLNREPLDVRIVHENV